MIREFKRKIKTETKHISSSNYCLLDINYSKTGSLMEPSNPNIKLLTAFRMQCSTKYPKEYLFTPLYYIYISYLFHFGIQLLLFSIYFVFLSSCFE